MIVKNISSGYINRKYLSGSGSQLAPGQATSVNASVSILDVIEDPVFLKDLGILRDTQFTTSTWAGFSSRVKVGDRVLAYGNGILNNPVSKAVSEPGDPKIALFLTFAEKALLEGIASAADDVMITDYVIVQSGDGASDISVGNFSDIGEAGSEFLDFDGDGSYLKTNGGVWKYYDGARSELYVSEQADDETFVGDYTHTASNLITAGNVSYLYLTVKTLGEDSVSEIGVASDIVSDGSVDIAANARLIKSGDTWRITTPDDLVYVGPTNASPVGDYDMLQVGGVVSESGDDYVFDVSDGATATVVVGTKVAVDALTESDNPIEFGTGAYHILKTGTGYAIAKLADGTVFDSATAAGEYSRSVRYGSVSAANVSCYSYDSTVFGKVSEVNADNGAVLGPDIVLAKRPSNWVVVDNGLTFTGPASTGNANGNYTRVVSVVITEALNPDAVTDIEGGGASVASVQEPESGFESAMAEKPAEAEPVVQEPEPVVQNTVVEAKAEPRRRKGKSIADLESSNKS